MASLAKVHQKRLQILHKVTHVKQGESASLYLMRLNAENEIKTVYTFTSFWRKTQIRAELGGFVDVIEVAENATINAQIAIGVHGLGHGSTFYKVQVRNAPNGLNRYWQFTILAVEQVAPSFFL